jgi:WD40 repeat protein
MSWRKGLVLGCLALFLFCGGGGAGLFFFLYQTFRGPTEAADRFLVLIGQDKAHDAYDMTAAGFRTGLDEPTFTTGVKQTGLGEYSAVSWSRWNSTNGVTTIEGAVTTRQATTIPVTLTLVEEDSRWKVLAMTPTPAASGSPVARGREREPQATTLSDNQRRIERAHDEAVHSVAFSADGTRVLSGGGPLVRLWDVESCQELARFEGHGAAVRAVAFADDGRRILTASEDQTLRVWDTGTRKELKSLQVLANPKGIVAFAADGRLALAGGLVDRTPGLWDVEAGKHLRAFDGTHVSGVYSLAFSPDGKRALSGGFDRAVRLWDVSTGKELRRFKAAAGMVEGSVNALIFSPDGRQAFLSGGVTPSPSLWEVERGEVVRLFKTTSEGTRSVAFSTDGTRVAAGSLEGPVRVWDAATGKELCQFKGHAGEVGAVAFSPDGRWVLSGGADRALRLWKLPPEAVPAAEQAGGE